MDGPVPLMLDRIAVTDLRARPGEILDRVRNEGHAFLIERKGCPLACVVPVSLLLPDIPQARLQEEFNDLKDKGIEFMVATTEHKELVIKAMHKVNGGEVVCLRVVLPHRYPHVAPKVFAEPLQKNPPHRWADGALCLYGASTLWNPGSHGVATSLDLAKQWLDSYGTWHRTGTWPNRGEA